jgi:hypothetical protein
MVLLESWSSMRDAGKHFRLPDGIEKEKLDEATPSSLTPTQHSASVRASGGGKAGLAFSKT